MIKSTPPQSAIEENVTKVLYQNWLSIKAVINSYCRVFILSLNLHERTFVVIWRYINKTELNKKQILANSLTRLIYI